MIGSDGEDISESCDEASYESIIGSQLCQVYKSGEQVELKVCPMIRVLIHSKTSQESESVFVVF